MQVFGLLSLVVVIAIAGWWLSNSVSVNSDSYGSETVQQKYTDVISDAEDVVSRIESRSGVDAVEIYDGISISADVTVLDLSKRNLSGSLKAEIRQLGNLRELDLSKNNFTGLPAEVGQLSRLEILNLSGNPLTGLPHELGNLHNLKVLDLSGTNYSQFDLDIIIGNLPDSVEIITN